MLVTLPKGVQKAVEDLINQCTTQVFERMIKDQNKGKVDKVKRSDNETVIWPNKAQKIQIDAGGLLAERAL